MGCMMSEANEEEREGTIRRERVNLEVEWIISKEEVSKT